MYTYLGAGLAATGLGAGGVAGVILWYGAGAVAGNLVGGCLADRVGSRLVIAASLAGLAISFLALSLALGHPIVIAPAFAAVSAVAQLFFPAQQAGLAGDFPARRAAVLAWNNAALFFGISLGSAIGGAAVAAGGFVAALGVSAVIAAAAWLLQTMLAGARAGAGTPAASIVDHKV
jgi:predicted MFS family arabinose efflux permease